MPTTRGWAASVCNCARASRGGLRRMVGMDGDAGVHVRLPVRQGDGLPAGWQVVSDRDEGRQARGPGTREGSVSVGVEIGHVHMTVGVNEHRRTPLFAHSSRCVAVWQTSSRGVPSWPQCPVTSATNARGLTASPLDFDITGGLKGVRQDGRIAVAGWARWRPKTPRQDGTPRGGSGGPAALSRHGHGGARATRESGFETFWQAGKGLDGAIGGLVGGQKRK